MKWMRIVGLAAAAALSMAAGKANWMATVTQGADGTHTLGNPEADVKLTEYVSYTCPHCAHFQTDSEAPLRIAYVRPGKVSVRVHNMVRDPIDFTAAMLTNCGDPAGFFKRHHTFLYNQDKWLPKLGEMTDATRQRFQTGSMVQRMRAVAQDFGFYQMMEQAGYTRARVDRCLADESMAEKLAAQTKAATDMGVPGTPSFAIDGELVEGVHGWEALNEELKTRLD